jgi:uncharacterized protein YbjT (DUF2867 family)
MRDTVLVLGATGRFGRPVVEHLARRGINTRTLARRSDRARACLGDVCEVVEGDVTDASSVRRALAGCAGAHVSISGPAELAAVTNVATAAAELDLARVSYVSGTATFERNDRFPLVKTKLACEQRLVECGVPWTIFCPSFAMELLPLHARGRSASYFGRQPHPFHWIAADDVGRMVATAYVTPATSGHRFYLWGPEAIPIHDALDRYCRARFTSATPPASLPLWLAWIVAATTGDAGMKTALTAYATFQGVGGDGGDPTAANQVLGAPEITLGEWLQVELAPHELAPNELSVAS